MKISEEDKGSTSEEQPVCEVCYQPASISDSLFEGKEIVCNGCYLSWLRVQITNHKLVSAHSLKGEDSNYPDFLAQLQQKV